MPQNDSTNTFETLNYNLAVYGELKSTLNRLDALEGGLKPVATNFSYYLDTTTGNDSNDGLSSGTPFLTLGKVQEVLNSFNWNNATFVLRINDGGSSLGTLSGRYVDNLQELLVVSGTLNDDLTAERFTKTIVFFSNCVVNSATLTLREGFDGEIEDCTFTGSPGVTCINVINVIEFTTSNNVYDGISAGNGIQMSGVLRALIDPDSTVGATFSTAFLRANNGCNHLEFRSSSSVSITGRLLSVSEDSSNLAITNNSSITSTLPDILQSGVTINGKITRGPFASDAAAGAAGVNAGELIESNGLGSAPFDVAGLVFVKQ